MPSTNCRGGNGAPHPEFSAAVLSYINGFPTDTYQKIAPTGLFAGGGGGAVYAYHTQPPYYQASFTPRDSGLGEALAAAEEGTGTGIVHTPKTEVYIRKWGADGHLAAAVVEDLWVIHIPLVIMFLKFRHHSLHPNIHIPLQGFHRPLEEVVDSIFVMHTLVPYNKGDILNDYFRRVR